LRKLKFLTLLSQLVRRVKTSRKKQNDRRFTIQSAHGFRKRFNTILKSNNSVNPSLAERMMGHSQTIQLDNAYFDPSVERLFEEFVRVIPELCIDESYKLRIENEAKQKKIEILEEKDQEIEKLKARFTNIENLLKNAETKKS